MAECAALVLRSKICRACLVVGEKVKFYEIKEKMPYFEGFVKLPMNPSEEHWLCHECNHIIGKALSFRDRIVNADFILKGLIGRFAKDEGMLIEYLKAARDVLSITSLTTTKPLTANYIEGETVDSMTVLTESPVVCNALKDETVAPINGMEDIIIKDEIIHIKVEKRESDDDMSYFDEADNIPLTSLKENCQVSPKKLKRTRRKQEALYDPTFDNSDKVHMITLNIEEQKAALKEQGDTKVYMEAVYKCEKCMKGFRFEETFTAHLERHSESYGHYKCDICLQYVKTATSYKSHLMNHSKRYKCSMCDYTRFSRSTVVEHYGAEHLKERMKMLCKICGKEFFKPSVLRKHIQYRHGNGDRSKPTCEHCGKTFTAQETLRLHMLKHLGPKPEGKKRYKCHVCDMRFRTPTLLRTHGIKHSDSRDWYCVECDLSFKSEFILKQHLKASKKHVDPSSLLECPQCPMKVLNQKLLDQHVEKMHLCVANHQCSLCPRAFYTNTLLRKHHRLVHEGIRPPKKHMCDICSKGFRTRRMLHSHIRTHTGEKPFRCQECDSCFGHSGTLSTHILLIHKKMKRNLSSSRKKHNSENQNNAEQPHKDPHR